tara:strand:+ start:98 stop:316 length:219 start_codon:yes stop_codon:yes gene_type:complete
MGAASSAVDAATAAPPLPAAVWIAVVVSAIACAGIVLCAGATPFVCPWYKPKPKRIDAGGVARMAGAVVVNV